MLALPASEPCLHGRLSSNVRPHNRSGVEAKSSFDIATSKCNSSRTRRKALLPRREATCGRGYSSARTEARYMPIRTTVAQAARPLARALRHLSASAVAQARMQTHEAGASCLWFATAFAPSAALRLPGSSTHQANSHECGLTLRSSRPAPARQPGRQGRSSMLPLSAGLPRLHSRLSSNVRPQTHRGVPCKSPSKEVSASLIDGGRTVTLRSCIMVGWPQPFAVGKRATSRTNWNSASKWRRSN